MQTTMKFQITINAPARETWRILAHEFENIDQWSSGIKTSKAYPHGTPPLGAKVCGRYCNSNIWEEFTDYDEEEMRFGYKGFGLPSFIKLGRFVRDHRQSRKRNSTRSMY